MIKNVWLGAKKSWCTKEKMNYVCALYEIFSMVGLWFIDHMLFKSGLRWLSKKMWSDIISKMAIWHNIDLQTFNSNYIGWGSVKWLNCQIIKFLHVANEVFSYFNFYLLKINLTFFIMLAWDFSVT